MDRPKKTVFLFFIINLNFACLSHPITSDVPDIIIKENGDICFTGKLKIKLIDGEKEIVVPKDVKPRGTCYNGEELSPQIIYEWPGTNEKYKNTAVIKWKHENNESYINFVAFAVKSENTGVLHSATMSDLHELEVTDGYRWHSDDEVYIKKKTEPDKSVSLSGAYQIGKNIAHQLSAAKKETSSITSESISNIKRRKHHDSADSAVHRPHSTQYNYLTKTSIQYSKPDIPTPSSDKPDTTIPYPDDGAKACIAASLTVKLQVLYKKSDDSDAIADLVIPTTKTHMDSSNCDSKGGNFEIVYKWNWDEFKSNPVRKPGTENSATIAWTKDPGTKQYSISSMIFNIKTNDVNLFDDAKKPDEVLSIDSGPIQLLTSSQGECSRCKHGQSIKDTAGTSTIDVSGAYELEAGNDGSSFSTQVVPCPADIPPNIPTPSSDKPDTTIPYPDDGAKACIAASLTVKLQVPYKKSDDSDAIADLVIPTTKIHMDSGNCDSKAGNFEIVYKWNWDDFKSNPIRKPGTDNTATVKWTKDPGTKQYSISSMIFNIKTNDVNLFEDAKNPGEVLSIDSGQIQILTSSQGECSRCKHGQSLKDTAGTSTIDVSGAYELEAGNDGSSFSTQVAPCPADIPPNIPTPSSDAPDSTIPYPDDATKTCIAASLTIKVQVPYKKADDSEGLANLVIPTTKTHIDSGKCDSKAGNFEIVYKWNWDDFTSNPARKPGTENTATIKWTKDPSTKQYTISSMIFSIKTNDPNLFEDAKSPDDVLSIDSGSIQLLTSSQGECSRCKHGQSIKDTASTSTIDVSGAYELEAGNDGSSFSTQVVPCPADIPPNIPTPSSDKPDTTIPNPDDATKTCIAASLTVQLQVPYKKADDLDAIADLVIPTTKTHMDSGKCDSKGGNFEIVYKWNWDDFTSNSARKPGTDNTATIKWTKDPGTKQYSISSMIFNIKTNDANFFEDAKNPDDVLSIDSGPIQLLTSSQGECSRCKHGQSMKDAAGTSTIDVSGAYELEAGNDGSSFSTQVALCPADVPPNIPTPSSDKPDTTIPYSDDATKTCIAASLTVKVQMPYKKADDTDGLANLVIPTTKTHMDSGKCDSRGGNFEIVYKWNWDDFTSSNPVRKPGTDNTATITWTNDTDTKQYSISSMTFSIKTNDPNLFEDAKEPDEVLAIDSGPIQILTSSKGQCSRCERGHLTTDPISKATINVSGAYELEAGNDGTSFSNATSVCSEDLTDNNNNNVSDDDGSPVGAIAGGTIAGLVVVIAASAFGFYYYRKHKNHKS